MDLGESLGTSKVSDVCKLSLRNPAKSGDAEERCLRRMNDTPQGRVIEGNAADDTLLVDQGGFHPGLTLLNFPFQITRNAL
jgi:hypothetical protein